MISLKVFRILLAFGALLAPFVAGAQSISVSVHTHFLSTLKDAQVDAILTDASSILQVDDDGPGTDDLPCNVSLVRSGPVQLLPMLAPLFINTEKERDAVLAEAPFPSGTSVKVVAVINFCDKAGMFSGCGPVHGRSMIVTETAVEPGVVWAHELGHNVGLCHADAAGRPQALMFSFGFGSPGTRRRVNLLECIGFTIGPHNPNEFPIPPSPCPGIAGTPTRVAQAGGQATPNDPPAGTLRDLVRTSFIDSVPYSFIAKHDPSEVQSLVSMLHDSTEQNSWANIATALGILGGPEIGQVLKEFIEAEPVGVAPPTIVRSKAAAVIALGYLLNKNGDPEVLQYLAARAQPRTWASSGAWLGQTAEARQVYAEGLSETAMIALALSGRPEAGPALQQAIGGLPNRQVDRNRQFMQHLAETHSRVQQEGLAAYYAASR